MPSFLFTQYTLYRTQTIMLRRTTLSTGQQDTERPDRNSDCARKPRLSALRTVFAEFGRWLWKEYCAVCFARRTRPEISESLLDEKDKQNGYGHNRKASSWNDGWLWEILSGVFSVICLIAIFVVLAVYEKKSVPQMPYNITVRTSHVQHVVSDWLCSSMQ